MDDILIFGANIEIVTEAKKYLSKKFDMKDLGEANIILGMDLKGHQKRFTLVNLKL